MGRGNIRLNFAESFTYIHIKGKTLSFKHDFGNIYWVFLPATRVNGTASYISNLMMLCKEFMEVTGTFGPDQLTLSTEHISGGIRMVLYQCKYSI